MSRRRRGAMAILALAGMVPVTAMMSANLNTTQMIDDRRQVQDAADALATVHGTWSARALNIISMNNVTAAQLLTVAVGSEALVMTLTELTGGATAASGVVKAHEAEHCTPRNKVEAILWTPFCLGWHEMVNFPAYLAMIRAGDITSDFDPAHGIETARAALDAIDGMNRELAARHPRAMKEIADDLRTLLEIDAHHFADPCVGTGLRDCRPTNSRDGMALPLDAATMEARMRLAGLMEFGPNFSDTTFRSRGFTTVGRGPMRAGGSRTRPELDRHINNITEIGNALYDFRRFYRSRISHMPRHPLKPGGNGNFAGFLGPEEPPYRGDRFEDRRHDLWDMSRIIGEVVEPINAMILGFLRNAPLLTFDKHVDRGYLLQPDQPRTRGNSFFRNYRMAHASMVVAPKMRSNIPIGFDFSSFSVIRPVSVPETFQLRGVSPLNLLPPVEDTAMPDDFRILAYAQKGKSRRLADTVMTSDVSGHTGYGQAGVFNPDGATLFTQKWRMRLMPGTRMDDASDAARDLDRQATASFDDLAEDLRQVRSRASWGRVHAH